MGLIEDMVRDAEIKRAEAEGRKPDFENPAGIAGVELNLTEESGAGNVNDPDASGESPVAEEVVAPAKDEKKK